MCVCVCVCMDLTLSLGDIIVFCSPLCGVVCVVPHIDNGPCCGVVAAITFIIFTAQLCWVGLSTECGGLRRRNLKLSNSH